MFLLLLGGKRKVLISPSTNCICSDLMPWDQLVPSSFTDTFVIVPALLS